MLMNNNIRLLLVSVVVALVNFNLVRAGCTMTLADADLCVINSGFFGNRKTIIPSSEADLDKKCSINMKNIDCILKYSNECLDGFEKGMVGQVGNMAKAHANSRCNNPVERKKFIDTSKCLLPAEANKMEPIHECVDKNIIMLEKVAEIPKELRVHGMCCAWHYTVNCIVSRTKKICPVSTAEYFDEVLQDAVGDQLESHCGEMKTLADCDKSFSPAIWKQLKDLAASDDPAVLAKRHKYHSPMAPTMLIAKSLMAPDK